MLLSKADPQDMRAVKKLWESVFDDGTAGFSDFVADNMSDRIYIAKEEDTPVSMLIAASRLVCGNRKGFYLYSACTAPRYRGKGYMKALAEHALNREREEGRTFAVLRPADRQLFAFWKGLGFDRPVKTREFDFEIKKNIWRSAEFDIVTASRLGPIRHKFFDGNMIDYDPSIPSEREKYLLYLYTFGGSTAENDDAFAVYYTEGDTVRVKELLARSTLGAVRLLQAVRERCGCERAVICLPEGSELFLGEGNEKDTYLCRGLENPGYINLMYE